MEYIYQLILYSRTCGSYHDFLDRRLLLTRKSYGRHHDLADRYEISVSQMTTDVFHFPVLPHSWLIIGFATRLTRRVPLGEQELPTLPEHLRSPPVFGGVRVTRSLVLSVCFVDRCLSICTFYFGHCVVCSSSICGFWLPFGIVKLFSRPFLVGFV